MVGVCARSTSPDPPGAEDEQDVLRGIRSDGAWLVFSLPKGWKENIVKFADGERSTYADIQKNRPDRALAVRLMREYVRSCRFAGCTADARYLEALGLKVPAAEK